jgi:hypothetical protein
MLPLFLALLPLSTFISSIRVRNTKDTFFHSTPLHKQHQAFFLVSVNFTLRVLKTLKLISNTYFVTPGNEGCSGRRFPEDSLAYSGVDNKHVDCLHLAWYIIAVKEFTCLCSISTHLLLMCTTDIIDVEDNQ